MTSDHKSDGAQALNKDSFVRFCAIATGVGFLGFVAWAGFVPLDEGISAHGAIVVESSRQVVQHLEGGIIAGLHVREGDTVAAGDPLVMLQETAMLAGRDQVLQAFAGLRASELRLLALQSGEAPDFAPVAEIGVDSAIIAPVVTRQERLYRQQIMAFNADLAVLQARRDGARSAASLKAAQIDSAHEALEATLGQLDTTRAMYGEQMARLDQVRGLERDVAGLAGDIARLRVEQVEARTLAADIEGQIAQASAEHEQRLAEELVDVRTRLLEAQENLFAAQDRLDRSVIIAPQAGEILNLRFATLGGVVRPGEPILEIVPEGSDLIASVRVRPIDRARVVEGQTVRAQIQAYEGWATPRLLGEVVSVSADLKSDPNTGTEYYEARIRIPEEELARAGNIELMPGMPMSAFIFAGTRRTTLEYLFEPISESLFRGLRTS